MKAKKTTNFADYFLFVVDLLGELKRAEINVCMKTSGFEFEIKTIKEHKKSFKSIDFNSISSITTSVKDSWLQIPCEGELRPSEKELLIIEGLSLLMSDFYIVENLVDKRQFAHGEGRSNLEEVKVIDGKEGLWVEEVEIVSFQTANDFWSRVEKLKTDKREKFVSALHLFYKSRVSYSKGEINEAVANAVSALEAMYMLPNPKGEYYLGDASIILDQKCFKPSRLDVNRKSSFDYVFTHDFTKNQLDVAAQQISSTLNIYEKRSRYLHGGEILIEEPQFGSQEASFLETTRGRLLDLLEYLS